MNNAKNKLNSKISWQKKTLPNRHYIRSIMPESIEKVLPKHHVEHFGLGPEQRRHA